MTELQIITIHYYYQFHTFDNLICNTRPIWNEFKNPLNQGAYRIDVHALGLDSEEWTVAEEK